MKPLCTRVHFSMWESTLYIYLSIDMRIIINLKTVTIWVRFYDTLLFVFCFFFISSLLGMVRFFPIHILY